MNRALIAGLLLGLASASAAQAEPPRPSAQIDAVLAKAGFSGVVAVSDGDGLIYENTPGASDRRWPWASVSKQVTATLVMQAVQDGRLSLDDTLALRLPAFRGRNAASVTLRNLLQHTAGLPNPDDTAVGVVDVPPFYVRTGAGVGGVKDAVGYCAGPPKRPAGVSFEYNNCDYLVLGAVLERATGRPFAALVAEQLARPLKLRTLGLEPVAGPQKVALGVQNLATYGAGGALTGSPRDLLAFDRALMAEGLLSPASKSALWKGDPKLGYVALGAWSFVAPLKGCAEPVALVERRGGIGAVEVRNVIAPSLKRAVVAFTTQPTPFGEVWQGSGLSYDLLSAAFCPA